MTTVNTLQHPIGTGFTAASTVDDVLAGIDLSGRYAVVTGGHVGLGLVTTRALSKAGATVVVGARDPERAAVAVAGIDRVHVEQLDLVDPESIDAFVTRYVQSGRPLHMLINNAGIMGGPLGRDARGYELHFATNHLGHFQLTTGLLPALRKAAGARVVNVTSGAHRLTGIRWDDPHFTAGEYDGHVAYGQSKTANILFAVELDRRWSGDGIRGYAVHPGLVWGTNLGPARGAGEAPSQPLPMEELRAQGLVDEAGNAVIDPDRGLKTPDQGASTAVFAATSPLLADIGGVYLKDNDIAPVDSTPVPAVFDGPPVTDVAPHAIDPESARRLWELSEQLLARGDRHGSETTSHRSTMKAAIVNQANATWVLEDRPVPALGENDVLVRVRACGICGTDVWMANGTLSFHEFPLCLGHEGVGEIVEVGPGVTSRKVGDRVGIPMAQKVCGQCDFCRQQHPLSFVSGVNCTGGARLTGVTVDGAFAEYIAADANGTVVLPEGISYEDAAPTLCAGYTVWAALRKVDPKPGARIAVVGIGGLGHLAVQYAKAAGYHVTAVTRTEDKHDLARRLGADVVVKDGAGLLEAGGADVLMHTSSSHAAIVDAMGGLKPWGKVVVMGVATDELPLPAGPLAFQGYEVIGSAHNGMQYLAEALQFVADGKVKPMVEVFPKERVGEAYEAAGTGRARFKAVVTF